MREGCDLALAKQKPDDCPSSGLHGHFDTFCLLLTLVELDGAEAHPVAVIKLAAGSVVQLHHIGQRHSVSLVSGRRTIPADGIDPLQIIGSQIAIEYLRVVVCVRFSELFDQILISDETHGDIHIFSELPDAAAFLRLAQLLTGYLTGSQAVKYALLPLGRR